MEPSALSLHASMSVPTVDWLLSDVGIQGVKKPAQPLGTLAWLPSLSISEISVIGWGYDNVPKPTSHLLQDGVLWKQLEFFSQAGQCEQPPYPTHLGSLQRYCVLRGETGFLSSPDGG